MMTQSTLPARADIPQEQTWDAERVYATREAWDADYQTAEAEIARLEDHRGHLADGPGALLAYLDDLSALAARVQKLFFYAVMATSVNTGDQQASALLGRVTGLMGQAAAAWAFAEPEMIAISEGTLRGWPAQDERLDVYAHLVDDLFRKQAHVRSAEVEEILGMLVDPLKSVEETASLLANADLTFAPATSSSGEALPVAQSTINARLHSADREERRSGWEHYQDAYLAHRNAFAGNLLVAFKGDVLKARARRFETALEAKLFEKAIPTAVFHNLIDTFRQHLPVWHRYWALRRRALGVDELHPYDIWAPLTDADIPVPFEQAVEWICAALAPLGEEYVSTLRRGCLEERWVDRAVNQGKRQGAFSFGAYDTPSFIMMSYNQTVASMSTLAHELGHSMHSHFTNTTQPYLYSDYSLFVAEVASNFNQAMTRGYLLEHQPDRDFQMTLIEEAMSNFHRYFFIMPTLARFELAIHTRVERGQPGGAEDMIAVMADLFEEAYGGQMHVDRERVGITWATFGHLYESFYPYQYATGISGAHALALPILAGDQAAAANYLRFLKAGASLYPLDALKLAGVDLTTPEPVERAFEVMAGYVDRLEALIG